jgi:hypothetical protein
MDTQTRSDSEDGYQTSKSPQPSSNKPLSKMQQFQKLVGQENKAAISITNVLTTAAQNSDSAPGLPPAPPAALSYFRFLEYSKEDDSCANPTKMLMEGKFIGRPENGEKYCFKDGLDVQGVKFTASVQCNDWCMKPGSVDADRPVAGPCTISLYGGDKCDEILKTDDGQEATERFHFNEGCTETKDKDGNVTDHRTNRCHNCCSGVGMITANGGTIFLTAIIAMYYSWLW